MTNPETIGALVAVAALRRYSDDTEADYMDDWEGVACDAAPILPLLYPTVDALMN